MHARFVCLLSFSCALSAIAQFYPQANAVWCGQDDDGGPPGFSVQFQMAATPDTLINGLLYQKVEEYNDAPDGFGYWSFVRMYYVRSEMDGKGYVHLPDSATEFLTGDLAAQAGDTVRDVLLSISNSTSVVYSMTDVIVDSVVTLSNAGITVVRHYIRTWGNPDGFFWQAGMGTSSGPVLELSGIFGHCMVNDTMQYDLTNGGLPGPSYPDFCRPINLSTPETAIRVHVGMMIKPNPVDDLVVIELIGESPILNGRLSLLDATGREVLSADMHGPLKVLDVSHLNGFFTVVIDTGGLRMTGRVIIQ